MGYAKYLFPLQEFAHSERPRAAKRNEFRIADARRMEILRHQREKPCPATAFRVGSDTILLRSISGVDRFSLIKVRVSPAKRIFLPKLCRPRAHHEHPVFLAIPLRPVDHTSSV